MLLKCLYTLQLIETVKELRFAKWLMKLVFMDNLWINFYYFKVGYDIGANEEKLPDLYMNDLDNELIPVIHSAVPLCRGGSVVLELIFHILEWGHILCWQVLYH